jgi:hypothetical protein
LALFHSWLSISFLLDIEKVCFHQKNVISLVDLLQVVADLDWPISFCPMGPTGKDGSVVYAYLESIDAALTSRDGEVIRYGIRN